MLLAILGSQPTLSLAELVSTYGKAKVRQVSDSIATIEGNKVLPLGGTIKLAEVLEQTKVDKLSALELTAHIPRDKKITIGISVYGGVSSARSVGKLALDLKKQLKVAGTPVRIVPNNQPALSSAQVLHNRLVDKGLELVILFDKSNTFIARTVYVQDIESYSLRDYGRPHRDPRVGMLPPKLAQIMLNLAHPPAVAPRLTILDPFCGTGVVLQEALLMGFNANGSDVSPRMVEYSAKNLEWLAAQYEIKPKWHVALGDAQSATYPRPISAVVTETYLGPPLSREPRIDVLKDPIAEVNKLLKNFLLNLAGQIKPGTPLCLAVPFWQIRGKAIDLPLIDQIRDFGYNHRSFGSPVGESSLRYRRDNQFVGRLLLVLEKQ